ncbi:hypothetical protein Bpfe_019975 [Biomphalaria pfeifferi]|uniref:Uncharacterized protein n=1 Tax=Biomphalaria pfeifferi TaxID=112525 RepID=A0AAD8B9U9_BIOPF|nr:hypothetical protein Bpfe_019975 [Biomphalaria pfeifferi]
MLPGLYLDLADTNPGVGAAGSGHIIVANVNTSGAALLVSISTSLTPPQGLELLEVVIPQKKVTTLKKLHSLQLLRRKLDIFAVNR